MLCHCGHEESEHKTLDGFDEEDRPCSSRGCRCRNFSAMDPDDVEFVSSLGEEK